MWLSDTGKTTEEVFTMPIYEYQREDGSVFEINQSVKADPLKVCPETGQKVKKLISKNAFHLKGGGWYKTDYSSSGSSSDSSSTSGDSTVSSSSSSDSGSSSSDSSGSESSGSASSGSSDDKSGGTKSAGCGTSCGCH
ncbi:MAG: zinc ribbon domain-containing protein [Bdellovibrionota bacterium]